MYFYYGLSALKIEVPYKKIVTILQILQFIIDLFACYGAWGFHHFVQRCHGTPRAGLVGCFILLSYLFLFIDFYDATYNVKDKNKHSGHKKTIKEE